MRPIVSLRAIALLVVLLPLAQLSGQVREQLVSFDRAGTVNAITPPLAARLDLRAPVWPVSGDYIDARLYSLGDSARAFVLVVRRPRDVIDRYPLDASQRAELEVAVARGSAQARERAGPDTAPQMISEPVRGSFVLNQSLLGLILFGPAAATLTSDPALGFATYLLVSGGTFFVATNLSKSIPVSRAQNHLSWHSARRGSLAASLALFAIAGEDAGGKAHAAALLAGGIAGDVIGFKIAKPLTDAEAHGTSHGSTVTGLLTTGLLGSSGLLSNESRARAGVAAVLAAGAAGYPLGLRYVRRAPYRVTAGDVGTLFTTELLGTAAASIFIAGDVSEEAISAALTAGFSLGLLAGERALVRPFDYTEAEARLLMLGAGAGSLIGLAFPVLASSDNERVILTAMTIGGALGVVLTHNMIAPRRADSRRATAAPVKGAESRFAYRFSPVGALSAGLKQPGRHSILSVTF